MIGTARKPRKGDAVVRRHIAQWRRITARLQVLMNTGAGGEALADEAHTLSRQCERLAADLGRVSGRPGGTGNRAERGG